MRGVFLFIFKYVINNFFFHDLRCHTYSKLLNNSKLRCFFRNLERNLEDNNGMTELDVIKI